MNSRDKQTQAVKRLTAYGDQPTETAYGDQPTETANGDQPTVAAQTYYISSIPSSQALNNPILQSKTGDHIQTLIEAIREELKKGTAKSKIKKDFLQQGYPKEIINDALIEAEELPAEPKTKDVIKEANLFKTTHTSIPEQPEVLQEKDKTSPYFFFLIFIILAWLGIAISFNIADSFGKAIESITPQEDNSFFNLCVHTIDEDYNERLCLLGQELLEQKKTDEKNIQQACEQISFDFRRIKACTEQLQQAIDAYELTH